jgi:uncharacterized protein
MAAGFGPLNLLVVQGTPFCNLDCDYCYLPDRGDRTRLSGAVLDAALDRVLESPYVAGPFTLLWHAGEPLALPRAFYDDATARIAAAIERHPSRAGLRIQQCVQTNATTINRDWCDCLRRNNIAVGVSLDGPAFLHDAHRRTRTGLGSHAATMRGIEWLQREGIPFHVIAVLTSDALDHADTIFDFFLEHGIADVGFNMEETEGANAHSSLGSELEQRYVAFLQRLWERNEASGGRLRCREFDGVLALAHADARLERTDMNRPFVIVNVDVHGNFTTFDPELLAVHTPEFGDFVFGNVLTDSLESVISTEKFQRVAGEMQAGVQLCRESCAYFGLCGGGAGSNKYWEHGSFAVSETLACRFRIKRVADVVLAALERNLQLA